MVLFVKKTTFTLNVWTAAASQPPALWLNLFLTMTPVTNFTLNVVVYPFVSEIP